MEPLTEALSRFGGAVFRVFTDYPIVLALALALLVGIWIAQSRWARATGSRRSSEG